jgi:hypothetical protein
VGRKPFRSAEEKLQVVLGVTAEAHVVLRENARRCGGAPVVRQWQMKPVDF